MLTRIERQLKKEKNSAIVTNEFRTALWSKLSAEIDSNKIAQPFALRFRFAVVGVASFVIVFGLGTGVYAYESPQVVEGHTLYFLKNNVEKLEERSAWTPEMRAQFRTRMVERRLREAKANQDQPELELRLLTKAGRELDLTVEELRGGLKNEQKRQEIIKKLKKINARYKSSAGRVYIDVR
ncbi:hypothetical protein HY771_04075 [Candidatus Uhrbacteria bacterium]|nr:hypothetical protein [Candidatus Uhrbacteria bacterium]